MFRPEHTIDDTIDTARYAARRLAELADETKRWAQAYRAAVQRLDAAGVPKDELARLLGVPVERVSHLCSRVGRRN